MKRFRFTLDLGFARILRNKKIDDNLISLFKKSYYMNKKLFKKSLGKFKIIVCDTEEEFKRESKYRYQKWGTATVLRNSDMVTRSPAFVEKIGRWKRRDFQNLMNHEMNHVFWTGFYHTTKPCWLLEGLACHVGNNFILPKNELKELVKKYDVKLKRSILDYRSLKRNFDAGHFPRYPIWANFTRYIARKYSVRELIMFMDSYAKKPVKSNYYKTFNRIFGEDVKKVFGEFIRSINRQSPENPGLRTIPA